MTRIPYLKCQGCTLEKSVRTHNSVTMIPVGERISKSSFDIHPLLQGPNFPVYSDFRFRYCSDCSNYTLWFMAFNDLQADIFKLNFQEKEISNQYFLENPQIKPRCVECESTNMNTKPIHECGGEISLEWIKTGVISEQLIFREWWYYPDGRIYRTNVDRY